MNLAEVLNVALPELPARRLGKDPPRLHSKLIAREQIEGGVPTVVAMISGDASLIRFSPDQWKIVELFDGKRSYGEIADLHQQQTGVALDEEWIRTFAAELDEAGLFHKNTLELNTTAKQKLAEQRRRAARKKIDLSLISISAWDPDVYLTKLHSAIGFVYTTWFTWLTLAMFAIMTLIFIGGWHEILQDTIDYYDFSSKSALDLAEFWLLFCGLGFFHESAHGLTCKHFGGGVHRMGFMLIYLSPAFFADVGEVYVYGGKWQRIAAIIAGIWCELMFCSVASIVWWGTPLGSPIHDFAYKIMLVTGLAVILLNLNPLVKLDGYYLFGELVGVSTLKESSSEYLSAWVKKNIFGLQVVVPYYPPRRRRLIAGYGIISGLYSYIVLFAVVRFAYNIFSRFTSEWAFVPALVLALLIFRGRLRGGIRFMREFYLDKQQHFHAWWTASRKAVAAAIAVIFIFAPIWRESVSGRFLLEPQQRAVVRAIVPGQVTQVLADEGSQVEAGTVILGLRNIHLEREASQSSTDLTLAAASARDAQIKQLDLGNARNEQQAQFERYRSVARQVGLLQISSPISGIVTTPRLGNLLGVYVDAGTELAEIENVQTLRARIFVPEFQVRRIVVGAPVSLKLESQFQPIRGQVESLSTSSFSIAPGLLHAEKYKGIALPSYYIADVPLSNSKGLLRPGMSGDAKIKVAQRSIAALGWETIREFVQRKAW